MRLMSSAVLIVMVVSLVEGFVLSCARNGLFFRTRAATSAVPLPVYARLFESSSYGTRFPKSSFLHKLRKFGKGILRKSNAPQAKDEAWR